MRFCGSLTLEVEKSFDIFSSLLKLINWKTDTFYSFKKKRQKMFLSMKNMYITWNHIGRKLLKVASKNKRKRVKLLVNLDLLVNSTRISGKDD